MSRTTTRASASAVLLPALTGFLVVRMLVLVAVLRLRPADADTPQGLLDPLLSADDGVIGRVAAQGYGGVVRTVDGGAFSDTAVWPLQPALVRLVGVLTGAEPSAASLEELSLAVSVTASFAAAAVLCLMVRATYGNRAAVATTWLWAALPVGASLWTSGPYAVLAALSFGSLLAWSAGRPVLAGALAGAAALTDPVGVAASAALVTGAVAALARGRMARASGAWALTLAATPPVAYAAWLADRRGSVDAVVTVLRSRAETEGGVRLLREQVSALLDSPAVVLVAALVAALAVGLVLSVADRQPVELAVHAAVALLLLGLTAPGLAAAGALSLVVVGAWMPLGDVIAARSRTQQALILTTLLVIALAWTSSGLPGSPWA
ncbi:hypothetical protein KLP28_06515 [Nocardioidaceae bacterium]|nr:hypothetical protein KLP28_06515 [Nocardioidaceae bacterium]